MRSVDILPTIVDALGGVQPWEMDGRSLLDEGYAGVDSLTLQDAAGTIRLNAARTLAQRDTAVRRKEQRFGTEAGSAGMFAPGRGQVLLGRPVADFPRSTERAGLSLFAAGAASPERMGVLADAAADAKEIAFAVDGILRATARPLSERSRESAGLFAAMLPDSARREYALVEAFAVDWSSGSPMLLSADPVDRALFELDLVSAVHPRIRRSGVYRLQQWARGPARWTNGDALIQLHGEELRVANSIEIGLTTDRDTESWLRISVGGAVAFETHDRKGRWERVLPVAQAADTLRIRFESDVFVPGELDSAKTDPRRLGVALQKVRLGRGGG